MPAEHTNTVTVSLLETRILRWTGIALAVLVAVLITPPAGAQVEPIEAKWMVVTRTTPMRCGDDPTFYKVADLKRGQVVRMDASNMRFGRIEYPAGQFAFVAKNDAELISETEMRLASETSKVRSPNAISGLAGSWRKLYFGDVREGAVLEIIGEVETTSGQVTGYRIVPPRPPVVEHPPYGYVELSAIREAAPEEVRAHLDALAPSADIPADPEPGTGTGDTSEPPASPVEETHADVSESEIDDPPAEDDRAQPEAAESDLLDDMVLPGEEPEINEPEGPAEQPADEPTGEDESAGAPAGTTTSDSPGDVPETSAEPAQPPRDWLVWNELETELKRVRGKGKASLEDALEELIAEYERSLGHAETEPMRHALTVRLDWLRLRKTARDQRVALDVALKQAEELRSGATHRVRSWQAGRYDIVGRLVPSAVYDGRRLPRMYRVRAAGETGLVRTIGYVHDVPSLGLETMVGRVVGIVGRSRLDNALHLRVITPARIDTLQAQAPRTSEPEG